MSKHADNGSTYAIGAAAVLAAAGLWLRRGSAASDPAGRARHLRNLLQPGSGASDAERVTAKRKLAELEAAHGPKIGVQESRASTPASAPASSPPGSPRGAAAPPEEPDDLPRWPPRPPPEPSWPSWHDCPVWVRIHVDPMMFFTSSKDWSHLAYVQRSRVGADITQWFHFGDKLSRPYYRQVVLVKRLDPVTEVGLVDILFDNVQDARQWMHELYGYDFFDFADEDVRRARLTGIGDDQQVQWELRDSKTTRKLKG